MQLHTLSVDVAASLIHEEPSSWHDVTLPAFAATRKKASSPSREVVPVQKEVVLALPPPDVKRRARQAALREARLARTDSTVGFESGKIAPVMSLAELSSLSSEDGYMRKTPSHSSISSNGDVVCGTLKKRGRKTRMHLRRHFVLSEGTLFNYKHEYDTRPSWKLTLQNAEVGTDVSTLRIVVCMEGERRLVLYARNVKEMETWACALARAADIASSGFGETEQTRRWSGERGCEDDVVDMAGLKKESVEWDSFRSFSALQIRTTWRKDLAEAM